LNRQPDDDQWYISRNEQQYGPLSFGDLAQFAKQGRVLEYDWVWKPGLASWVAAGDISALFTKSSQLRHDPRQVERCEGKGSEKPELEPNFKKRAKDQIKSFGAMFLYLWIVFGILAIHESIILSQHQIAFVSHGLAFVNALVFAKVMLVAEDLRLGGRLNDKPLIYSVVFKSILFAIALICFHIVEHTLIGMWHGKPMAESIAEVGANRLAGIISLGIMSTVALTPYFILSEFGRVIGSDNFWALFFQRRSS
jgi:GYF domain 2